MRYLEDIFVQFYNLAVCGSIVISTKDWHPLSSFFQLCLNNNPLTEKQAELMCRILKKYQQESLLAGLDFSQELENRTWKHPFRVIDDYKRLFIHVSQPGTPWICVQSPYHLKGVLDEELDIKKSSDHRFLWDPTIRARKYPIHSANPILFYEFAVKHNFEIDDNFMMYLATYEEVYESIDTVFPFSQIIDGKVVLVNPKGIAFTYWQANQTHQLADDLLLAKSMGYPLINPSNTLIEKISSTPNNIFWTKDLLGILQIAASLNGKTCIVLDRETKLKSWLKTFDQHIDRLNIDRSLVKICFRLDNSDLNQWIADKGYGGKVDQGKILIFNHKPAKWLFKDSNSVKLVVSNSYYPPTQVVTREWMNTHPCVIYQGDIRPSVTKGNTIVDL